MQLGNGFTLAASGYAKNVEVSTVGDKGTTKLSFRMSKRIYEKGVDKADQQWMNVGFVLFGKGAERAAEYLTEGAYVSCSGEVTIKTKEFKGEQRTFTDVRIDDNSLVIGPKGNGGSAADSAAPAEEGSDLPF